MVMKMITNYITKGIYSAYDHLSVVLARINQPRLRNFGSCYGLCDANNQTTLQEQIVPTEVSSGQLSPVKTG